MTVCLVLVFITLAAILFCSCTQSQIEAGRKNRLVPLDVVVNQHYISTKEYKKSDQDGCSEVKVCCMK